MSERKVLNKYYPPDFDPSKIPRLKQARNRQYTVRMMAPFNMRCVTCGEYIYKGKKFNARKEDVENDDYLGIRIYRFYIKCTRCLQEISFKTDPKNTDYEIEAGATRNFMALKRAEEQAERELQEVKDEEANNPMKQLENRTQQSRNEIELLESLEELRDLNRRQQSVDYESMLKQYDQHETAREREERLERQDEEYVKSLKFGNSSNKIIVSEEIIELDNNQQDESINISDYNDKNTEMDTNLNSSTKSEVIKTNKSITNNWNKSIGVSKKYSIGALVKKKTDCKQDTTQNYEKSNILEKTKIENTKIVENVKVVENVKTKDEIGVENTKNDVGNTKINALSMLGAYSDSDENSD